jgi:hypothetical protein
MDSNHRFRANRRHRSVTGRRRNSELLKDVSGSKNGCLMEIAMERQADRDAIADGAVGQRRGNAPPEAVVGARDSLEVTQRRQGALGSLPGHDHAQRRRSPRPYRRRAIQSREER